MRRERKASGFERSGNGGISSNVTLAVARNNKVKISIKVVYAETRAWNVI